MHPIIGILQALAGQGKPGWQRVIPSILQILMQQPRYAMDERLPNGQFPWQIGPANPWGSLPNAPTIWEFPRGTSRKGVQF